MKAEYSENSKTGKLNTIYEIVCALILGGACFYVFISMFGLEYGPSTMFSGSFSGGLAGIWDAVADVLGSLDYVILPKYKADITAGGTVQYGFALTMILAAFSVISFLIIKARVRLLLLIYAVPLAVLMILFMLEPSAAAGILFASAVLVVLSLINIRGKIKPAYFILPVTAVLISSLIAFAVDSTVSLRAPKALSDQGASVRASVEKSLYGTDPLPAGEIGSLTGKQLKAERGDISSVKSALSGPLGENGKKSGKDSGKAPALKVTMSEPESYYLRGFVGAEYLKNRWNTLKNDVFYDMRDKIFSMNRKGFDGLSELSYASKLGGAAAKEIDIKIKVKGASKKTAFVPYELELRQASGDKARKSEMVLPAGTKNYGGSYLGTEGLRGKSEYSYKASENITGIWTDAVGKFYTTRTNEEINRFFISESHYNVMQYKHYLDVPETLIPLFEKEVGGTGDISRNHADYKDTIDILSRYLYDKYIYSETFSEVKKKEDFVKSFIEAKRGCDVHFATLATLLFRYFGIPARYVEGYLITPANISTASGKATLTVPRSANHAWTEIYIDGFGWIPFEATPEYSGIMKEADLAKGLQNVDYENIQHDQINVEEEEPEEEEDEEEEDLKALLMKILRIVLIVLGSILLLVLLVLGLIRLVRFIKWRRAFADKDPKAGIRALYQYSAEKKWKLADAGEELGMRASYSLDSMKESERGKMREEIKHAKERAKAQKGKK